MFRSLIFLMTFVAAAALAALALALPQHRGLNPDLAALALGIGLAAGSAAFIMTPPARLFRGRRLSPWAWLTFTAFGLFALRAYGWLIYYNDDHIEIGSPNNLGDLSLHMLFARYFANGAAWWPDHPQNALSAMRYYPGIDLFQSLLLLCGADEFRALVWVGLLGAGATAVALYIWGGSFAVAGFLFSGGLAGFKIFTAWQFKDYQAAVDWKSLPLALFVTQRGWLYALPAGLLLLAHWRQKFFPPQPSSLGWPAADPLVPKGRGLLPFWVEALLYTAMPVFHVFTFVFLSLLLGWWFVAGFSRTALRRHLLLLVGIALLPATFQVWLMTNGFHGAGMLWIRPGWMQPRQPFLLFWKNFLPYWLKNFGLFAPLAAGLWLWRVGKLAGEARSGAPGEDTAVDAYLLPAGLIFLLTCVVMFAPWEWDNTKLMLWCYVTALPFLWEEIVGPLRALVRWPLCAVLFLSGCVSLLGGLKPRTPGIVLASRPEVDGVYSAVRALPIEARFAAAPDYNHPLVFSGRKLAMGYAGHLHSQGFDYQPLEKELSSLMLGQPGWEQSAARLGVRYLFWGRWEEKRYESSARPWEKTARLVAQGDWGSIYDLSAKPLTGSEGEAAEPSAIGAATH